MKRFQLEPKNANTFINPEATGRTSVPEMPGKMSFGGLTHEEQTRPLIFK
jgi:hypothetical protein